MARLQRAFPHLRIEMWAPGYISSIEGNGKSMSQGLKPRLFCVHIAGTKVPAYLRSVFPHLKIEIWGTRQERAMANTEILELRSRMTSKGKCGDSSCPSQQSWPGTPFAAPCGLRSE